MPRWKSARAESRHKAAPTKGLLQEGSDKGDSTSHFRVCSPCKNPLCPAGRLTACALQRGGESASFTADPTPPATGRCPLFPFHSHHESESTPFKSTRIASLKTADDSRAHVAALGLNLPCEDAIAAGPDSPLAPLRREWGEGHLWRRGNGDPARRAGESQPADDPRGKLLDLSAGSPYYNPHLQRPAAYPPSDGYQPAHDPLIDVARQINVVRQVKEHLAGLRRSKPGVPAPVVIGTAYSYLQEYLPHVAQYAVRHDWTDMVGLGRVVLSYPERLADATTKGVLATRFNCRTFSDCTTGPRNGLISGCYPLDEYYKAKPEYHQLKQIKKAAGV